MPRCVEYRERRRVIARSGCARYSRRTGSAYLLISRGHPRSSQFRSARIAVQSFVPRELADGPSVTWSFNPSRFFGAMRSQALAAFLFALACGSDPAPAPATVLLFNGTGTSAGDVAAVESVLHDAHLDYATASSRQLDAMTAENLRAYRLLIVPGGNFERIG